MIGYRCNLCTHVWVQEPVVFYDIPYACPQCGAEGDFEVESEVVDLAHARKLFGEMPRAKT